MQSIDAELPNLTYEQWDAWADTRVNLGSKRHRRLIVTSAAVCLMSTFMVGLYIGVYDGWVSWLGAFAFAVVCGLHVKLVKDNLTGYRIARTRETAPIPKWLYYGFLSEWIGAWERRDKYKAAVWARRKAGLKNTFRIRR